MQKTNASVETPVEYKVVKPFTSVTLFRQDPCKTEFLKFLAEGWCTTTIFRMWGDIIHSRTLMNNLAWLEDKGFIKNMNSPISYGVKFKLTTDGAPDTEACLIQTGPGIGQLIDLSRSNRVFDFTVKLPTTLAEIQAAVKRDNPTVQVELVED